MNQQTAMKAISKYGELMHDYESEAIAQLWGRYRSALGRYQDMDHEDDKTAARSEKNFHRAIYHRACALVAYALIERDSKRQRKPYKVNGIVTGVYQLDSMPAMFGRGGLTVGEVL